MDLNDLLIHLISVPHPAVVSVSRLRFIADPLHAVLFPLIFGLLVGNLQFCHHYSV